jgi:hypothetical protein
MRPAVLVFPVLLFGTTLSAQDVDSIRRSYTLSLPPTLQIERIPFWISPGSSSGTPTAYGAEFGDVFFGAGYQRRARYSHLDDGDAYVGFGLGNPRDYFGIELNFTSFTTVRHLQRIELQLQDPPRLAGKLRHCLRLGGCDPFQRHRRQKQHVRGADREHPDPG